MTTWLRYRLLKIKMIRSSHMRAWTRLTDIYFVWKLCRSYRFRICLFNYGIILICASQCFRVPPYMHWCLSVKPGTMTATPMKAAFVVGDTILCSATGVEPIAYHWRVNDTIQVYDNPVLTVVQSMIGPVTFQCTATNIYGTRQLIIVTSVSGTLSI